MSQIHHEYDKIILVFYLSRRAMETNTYTIKSTESLPLGAAYTDAGVRFASVFNSTCDCGVLIFLKDSNGPLKIPFPEECRHGRIFSMEVCGLGEFDNYLYYEGENIFLDPYMKASFGYGDFGVETKPFSVVSKDNYIHVNKRPEYKFSECVFYMLHVRGFTAHNSSRVKEKGTYRGLMSKLDYIKSLGVTSVILMPVYEFNEIIKSAADIKAYIPSENISDTIRELGRFTNSKEEYPKPMVNYWGYTDGYYYTPKHSYASSQDAVLEFHELVEKAHSIGLEIILQFSFPKDYTTGQITDILRFWEEKYNVDGFQIIGCGINYSEILKDPLIYGLKLLSDEVPYIHGNDFNPSHGHTDMGYLVDMRCFLKGDPNHAEIAAKRMRDADPVRHPINTLARQDTMRLSDIVMYNEKHNLENGENGCDGADLNFSWNCGVEGATRKKNILALREKQIKNALIFTILSQGSPLIYSGDEFGNTQYGNNNPYNQDNATSYIKWSSSSMTGELLDFTRKLIAIKKGHPALCSDHLISGRDQLSLGYPDVSLHGSSLWRPDLSPTSHSFGILYFDKYFNMDDDRLVYITINMHWEKQDIALPKTVDAEWKKLISSDDKNIIQDNRAVTLEPRSIMVLETVVKEKA